jgi:hypothetical protein
VGHERFDLLAAAAEDERVAALQPDHAPTLQREPHEQRVDLVLRQRVPGARLADVDQLRIAACEVEDVGTDEAVVDDDVGLRDQPRRAQRQQIRISRTGADEMDDPRH